MLRAFWLTVYLASLWMVFFCDARPSSVVPFMLPFTSSIIAAFAAFHADIESSRRAAVCMMVLAVLDRPQHAIVLDQWTTTEPLQWLVPTTTNAARILLASGPLMLLLVCGLSLWRHRRHALTYVQIPSPDGHLQTMKPAASAVVSTAVPEQTPPMFLAPEPPSHLPTARALSPAFGRPERLTGERLTILQIMLGALVVLGVLGAIASLTTGYEIYDDGSNVLLKTRPAGSGATVFWCLAGAALAALGLARPTRANAKAIGCMFLLLIVVGSFAVLSIDGLINLDDFSFSQHTVETGSVAMLQVAIGAMFFAGPIILLAQWRLFRH